MAKKIRIYLDISVISYLYQIDAEEKMKVTREVWELLKEEKFEVCISNIVIDEIEECFEEKRIILKTYLRELSLIYLEKNKLSESIREQLLIFQVLSPRSSDDCSHISLALANNCDYILSWNFRHFVNPRTINGVNKLSQINSLNNINIISPDIFLIFIREGVVK